MIKSFYTPETSPKEDHFYGIDRVGWAAPNGVWTKFLALKLSEIMEEECVKNVTALRLDKP